MDDCEKNNSKPIVHWVSAAAPTEERFEVELLKIDFAVQLYTSAEEFLSSYDENSIGCVVLCRDNFGREESDLYRHIVHRNKIAPVILCLSSLDVPDVVRAIKLGFADVVRMHSDVEQIRVSLQEATELEQTSRRGCFPSIHQEILSMLNAEEVRIFQRLAEGVSNKQISVELGLSVRTIHYRKKIIFEKLRVCNRIEAVELMRTYRSGNEHLSLIDSAKNNTSS
ncbi:MAG: response regulator transcription factor [Pirellula sp.]|jgi:FixJ family two-component response regulator|nr:LuxR C-terminal-related transcriptional regulator [Pirellula sp.]